MTTLAFFEIQRSNEFLDWRSEVLMTAADVLKGVNTDNTNRWFQLLAIGAARFGKVQLIYQKLTACVL